MNVITYCVVLATYLINLSAGEKLDLNYEIKFSKDPSACSNLPRCCPSGMSNSGKCIIRNKTSNEPNKQEILVDTNFTCKFQRAILGYDTSEKLTISRHGYLLLTEEDTITKINAFTTYCINKMGHKTIAFVCGEKPDALFTIYINPALKIISGITVFLFCLCYLASSWRKTHLIVAYTVMTGIEYIMIGINNWSANGESKLNPEYLIDNLTVYVMLSSHFCLLLMIAMNAGVFKHSNLTFKLCITYIITIAFIPFIIVLVTVLKDLVTETVINVVVFIVMCIIFVLFVVAWFIMASRQEIQQDDLILECHAIFIIRSANFWFLEMIPWISTLDSLLGPVVFLLLRNKF